MTSMTSLAHCTPLSSPSFRLRAVMGLAAALTVAPTPLLAEARVQGSREAVRIETQNSSIEEVLTALGNAFQLRYRSSANLAKQLSGTYEGSLPRVVARVLEGYDFVLRNNNGKIEITVLGTRNAASGAALASSTTTPAKAAPSSPPGTAVPAPALSTGNERSVPAAPPPASAPRSGEMKVAETPMSAPTATASDPTKLAELNVAATMPAGLVPAPATTDGAAIVPTPMPASGSAPIPEPIAGTAAVPMPVPGSGSAPFPEPVTGDTTRPMPEVGSGAPIPAVAVGALPQPTAVPSSPPGSSPPIPQK